MKKIYSLLLLAGLVTTAAQAQTSMMKKKPTWGLKTGINISNLMLKDAEDAEWKTGLVAGVFVNFKVDSTWSIQPEFLYSSMGARGLVNTEGRFVNNVSSTSLRLNYLSLPILGKYRCKNFAIVAGPQVDVLVIAKTKSDNSSDKFQEVSNSYKETSVAATAGVEFWPMHCFGLTARYMYGFSNINAFEENVSGGNVVPKVRNQGVQITASFKL